MFRLVRLEPDGYRLLSTEPRINHIAANVSNAGVGVDEEIHVEFVHVNMCGINTTIGIVEDPPCLLIGHSEKDVWMSFQEFLDQVMKCEQK